MVCLELCLCYIKYKTNDCTDRSRDHLLPGQTQKTTTTHPIIFSIFRNPNVRALITTGEGRFYCNGIDLNWMKFLAQSSPQKVALFRKRHLTGICTRLLTFPVPTIAAINGEYHFAFV